VICFREDDARLELSILISFVDILGGYNWLLGEVYKEGVREYILAVGTEWSPKGRDCIHLKLLRILLTVLSNVSQTSDTDS
jgi:hypothetical protein